MIKKKKTNKHIRVLAFDPSIQNMGYCVLDYDTVKNTTNIFRTGKIQGNLLYKNKELKQQNETFTKRFTILDGIRIEVGKLLELYKPDYVVSEGAFYYRFVNSIIVLTLIIHQIRVSSKKYNGKDIYIIAPKQTKSEITGNDNADKLEIKNTLLKNKEKLGITIPKSIDINKLSFDEIDSIGHGLTFIKIMLPNLLVANNFKLINTVK